MGFDIIDRCNTLPKDVCMDLTCPLCEKIFERPVQCLDGHSFCVGCLDKKYDIICPHAGCSAKIYGKRPIHNRVVALLVGRLKVRCVHGKCDWVGTPYDIYEHEGVECLWFQAPCRVPGCGVLVAQRDAVDHERDFGPAHADLIDSIEKEVDEDMRILKTVLTEKKRLRSTLSDMQSILSDRSYKKTRDDYSDCLSLQRIIACNILFDVVAQETGTVNLYSVSYPSKFFAGTFCLKFEDGTSHTLEVAPFNNKGLLCRIPYPMSASGTMINIETVNLTILPVDITSP